VGPLKRFIYHYTHRKKSEGWGWADLKKVKSFFKQGINACSCRKLGRSYGKQPLTLRRKQLKIKEFCTYTGT